MKPSALNLRLTEEQRFRLVADAQSYCEQYRAEMQASWVPKRLEFERQANADFSSRRSGDPTQQRIYDLSNESLNLVRNVTRFMKARCSEDIFGSKPFIGISAVGTLDEPLADQIGRHGPWKLDQGHYARMGKEAIGLALDLGEAIIKTTHRTEHDLYERRELVLVRKAGGKPVIAPLFDEAGNPRKNAAGDDEGDYIYPEDPTIAGENGTQVYEKDPSVPVDEQTEFREVLVEEDEVTYHGIDVANVRFDAFLAPLNVATLHEAPCVAHEYSRTVSQLRALYGKKGDADMEALFDLLATEPEGPKTPEDQPRTTHGEVSAGTQRLHHNPPVKVREIYLRDYDVFGDGRGRNIFLVLAADLDEPLYLEYLANITVRGRLPFHAVPVNRVPGRWYGRGFYEIYEGAQQLVDALINGILVHNEDAADPLTFFQPDAVEEGRAEKRLIRGPRKTYTLRPGKSAKDAAQIVVFPDLDERTWQLVQLIMQLVQTDSGVTSAAQGDYSALPSASTATGISSILQSASTLHRMLTEDLKDGFEPAVLFALMTIYARQDKDETFRYLEGKAAEVLSLASARTLAVIELNVRILLTRFQMREQREQAQLVITNVLPAWVQALQISGLPTFEVAQNAQRLFIQVAKGADIQQADEIFALPERPPPAPVLPAEEASATGAPAEEAAAPALPVNVIAPPAAEGSAGQQPAA